MLRLPRFSLRQACILHKTTASSARSFSTSSLTPYQILDVGFGASEAEIKKAYRVKVKALHPDVNPSDAAAEQFQAVQTAYEELLSTKSGSASQVPKARHGTAYSVEELNQRAERFRRTRMGNPSRVATADNINAAWIFLLAVPIVLMVVRSMTDPSARRKDDPNEERVQAWWNPISHRWETPAPWSRVYQENRSTTRMVPRSQVNAPNPAVGLHAPDSASAHS